MNPKIIEAWEKKKDLYKPVDGVVPATPSDVENLQYDLRKLYKTSWPGLTSHLFLIPDDFKDFLILRGDRCLQTGPNHYEWFSPEIILAQTRESFTRGPTPDKTSEMWMIIGETGDMHFTFLNGDVNGRRFGQVMVARYGHPWDREMDQDYLGDFIEFVGG